MALCRKCGVEKPQAEFHKDSTKRSGYHSLCRVCDAEKHRAWRAKSKATEKYKAMRRAVSSRWIKNNPEKAAAHKKALMNKSLVLKEACEKCGSTNRLHMHHPDYGKPLYVITLCNDCHIIEHHGRIHK